jgi:eukaryotic-like serine/threonine-protein kinase
MLKTLPENPMPTNPVRTQTVFVAAAEIADPAARALYVAEACGDDLQLKARVEALLLAHDQPDSMLDIPLVAPSDTDHAVTQAYVPKSHSAATRKSSEAADESDDEPLTFLTPSDRRGSLGRIGHYEVLQVLGKGGFGIVLRAFDDVLHRVVAVKVMAPLIAATSPARKRFLREARTSAQVRHENVVQVHEVGEQPLPFLVMEFIPGETLQQRLERVGPLDVNEVVRIGRQIAEGLAAAHATDLIHRDIKPGNILLEGAQLRVKITDFGLARAADDASISQSGIIAGTPMYMAPEQALGYKLDQRADLFSLGSVLYQMAAGRPPFRANGTVAVLKRVAEDTPRDIREITPETPQWLCDIISKLHAKNPDDRYQSAREVVDVLADCETQLKANSKLNDFSRIPRGTTPHSGRRKWVAAAAAVLLSVIALAMTEFAGVTHLFRQQATPDPIKFGSGPTPPIPVTKQESQDDSGWAQLFNGKDLAGWQMLSNQPGEWRVIDSILVGTGPRQLYTVRDDFRNFHLRAEIKVSKGADNGIYFRAKMEPPSPPGKGRAPSGYVADIAEGQDAYTGPISFRNPQNDSWTTFGANSIVKPGEWFTLDLIADGNHLVTKVNGVTAVDTVEALDA